MKKIEFLNNLAKEVWGPEVEVEYDGSCGQSFWLIDSGVQRYLRVLYVDNLPRGRCSIKIKYYREEWKARCVSQLLYNALCRGPYTVDTATKVAPYKGRPCPGYPEHWVARLICDRYWD